MDGCADGGIGIVLHMRDQADGRDKLKGWAMAAGQKLPIFCNSSDKTDVQRDSTPDLLALHS